MVSSPFLLFRYPVYLYLLSVLCACSEQSPVAGQSPAEIKQVAEQTVQKPVPLPPADDVVKDDYDYDKLRQRIYVGKATTVEIRQALSEEDPYALTNTVHGLFAMRWHRAVHHLLRAMWIDNRDMAPQLAWQQISTAPVRLALASTINRTEITGTDEQLAYLRSYQDDLHEFNRAQVVIALGFNGDPADLSYVKSMADGGNHYVAQTAITALALMGGNRARDAMIDLWQQHQDSERGDLLLELLQKSYRWRPEKTESAIVEGVDTPN